MPTAKEFYNSLESSKSPKRLLLEKIASECGCSVRQAERYITRDTEPAMADKKAISEITGISVEELYPEKEEVL